MSMIDAELGNDTKINIEQNHASSLLPCLSCTSKIYPGCCLALSKRLIEILDCNLPPAPDIILSIGSGYGLLEALLLANSARTNIFGIEVHPSPNRYLPPSQHYEVAGTRFHAALAANAKAWMFIYPRRVGLVQEYLETYGHNAVELVVWAGPAADWEEYRGCFARERPGYGWHVKTMPADTMGGCAWDLIAYAAKTLK